MEIAVLGIDLGKNLCSVVGLDDAGAVVLRRRARRETLIARVAKLPPCIVAMEACCGAHHLGRLFAAEGHDVRLMSPEYVRPYVKAQKNDDRDAESTAMVNHYYFYCVDEDFGPFFLKFCAYFPYNAKLCINGHEYLKRHCPSAQLNSRRSITAENLAPQ
jgi:hypothetical protein